MLYNYNPQIAYNILLLFFIFLKCQNIALYMFICPAQHTASKGNDFQLCQEINTDFLHI